MIPSTEKLLTIDDLSKGMNTYDPETRVPKGFYIDAQNMLLTNKSPITIGGLTKLNTTACPSGNIVWFEPFTRIGENTSYLVATSTGRLYKYNPDTDVWTHKLRGLSTTATIWSHVPYRGVIMFSNGVDPVFKYDGDRVLPVGAAGSIDFVVEVTDFEDNTNWTNGTLQAAVHTEGANGRQLAGTANMFLDFPSPKDFSTSLGTTPVFKIMCATNITPTTVRFRFGNAAGTNYYEVSRSVVQLGMPMERHSVPRADFATTGSPTWASIERFTIFVDDAGETCYFDDAFWQASTSAFQEVADFDVDETGWSGTITNETTDIRQGDQAKKIVGIVNMQRDFTAPADYLTGLQGAPAFVATDTFKMKVKRTAGAGTGTITIRFGNTADTVYFQATTTVTSSDWTTLSVLRSAFALTGVPVWSSIERFRLAGTTTDEILVDDAYWQYALSPPIADHVDSYQQQLVVAGDDADKIAVKYSDAGSPDYFPAANVARFSGGRHALEKEDQITALRSYFDELIVGKVTSSWTFSGTGSNVSVSALPLTIGIDAHRGIVETPWSLHFLYENNIFGARLTSRGLVSQNISSLLSTIDSAAVQNTVAIRSDRTRTTRWSLRNTGSSTNNLGLIYDYQLDAWASQYSPRVDYYSRAAISGVRELLCTQGGTAILRVDVGTTFDGTAIVSYVILPWMQAPSDTGRQSNVVQWTRITSYLKGTATVNIDARFADEPHEFSSASYTTYDSITATPDVDKGTTLVGRTSRWIQVRLRATALSFEVIMPLLIHYIDTTKRI